MVMHARALDADLGRKVAKAEAPVSGVRIWASARSINRSAVSLTVLPLSIDRYLLTTRITGAIIGYQPIDR